MKKVKATESTTYQCEFCNATLKTERAFSKHLCSKKQRWNDRQNPQNRIAFNAWSKFNNSMNIRNKTQLDFIHSRYYGEFLKFGTYCIDVGVINIDQYTDWVIKEKLKLSAWFTDSTYELFIIEYLRQEEVYAALQRTIEYLMELTKNSTIQVHDCLRSYNKNVLCQAIITGKISPWVLYQSTSGIEFLRSLDDSQIEMVMRYISPERWAIKFVRDEQMTNDVKNLLQSAGF